MAKRMLADVLWEAANVHLRDEEGKGEPSCRWSCNAAMAAEFGARFHWEYANGDTLALRRRSEAIRLMERLGVDPNSATSFEHIEDPQSARHMWLLLAMHVAEDEGIEVSA